MFSQAAIATITVLPYLWSLTQGLAYRGVYATAVTLANLAGFAAFLAAGAQEAWIVYSKSKRIEMHDLSGVLEQSRFEVDLNGLFD